MANPNERPGGNLNKFINERVNSDSIKGKYKEFKDSDVEGRYNVGKMGDDLSSIAEDLPSRYNNWISAQGGQFTREDFYSKAREEGAARGLGSFGVATSQAQAELELALAEKRWAKFVLGQSESFLDAVENVSNVINLTYKPQLEIGKTTLQAYVEYLTLLQNPSLTVLKEFVETLRNFFRDLGETGIYWIQMTSNDIGKNVTFSLKLNSDWVLLQKSSFITNPITRKVEYIDYEYNKDPITGRPIIDKRTGSPIPITDDSGQTIRRSSRVNPGFLSDWSTLPIKQASFSDFISKLKEEFNYQELENGCITPKRTPAFTSDAVTAAMVLYIGAPSIKSFAPIAVKLANALQGPLFQPIISFIRLFYTFGNLFEGLEQVFVGKQPDSTPIVLNFTKVRNPGEGGQNRKKFIAGARPVLIWDKDAKNDAGNSYGNYVYPDRKEVDSTTTNLSETPSIAYLIRNPQGQLNEPDRVFIRGEQSGVVLEVCHVHSEKLIKATSTTQQTVNSETGEVDEYIEPSAVSSEPEYYNQTLICRIVDEGLETNSIILGERFYEVEPHGIYEPVDSSTGEVVEENAVYAYQWRMKNGYNLLGGTSERDIVTEAIKYAQIQHYFSGTSINDGGQDEATTARLQFENRISQEGIAVLVPVKRSDTEREYEFSISGGDYSASSNRTRFELRVIKPDEVTEETRSSWNKAYKSQYVNNLWNYVSNVSAYTDDISTYQERAKNSNSILSSVDNTYRPIENALFDFISDSSVTNIFGSSNDILIALRNREWWTWRQDFELSPSPVYGTLVGINSDILKPSNNEIAASCPEGNTLWDSFKLRDLQGFDSVMEYIDYFLDIVEGIIGEFDILIKSIIGILNDLIKNIEELVSALDSFLNFLLALGDLGLYILLVDNQVGGNLRIMDQIENAPNRPPNTLKHGWMGVAMAGWPSFEEDGPTAKAWDGVKTIFGLTGDENQNPDYGKTQ